MRWWIAGTFLLLAVCPLALSAAQARPDEHPLTVTLLGTGSPRPDADRFGMATLVEAGHQKLLFDAGRGSSIRLWQAGVSLGRLDAVFLTHLHSDHVSGLPDILLTGWIGGLPYADRKEPLVLFGPAGTKNMGDKIVEAYSEDIRIRIADEGLSRDGARFDTTEFTTDGVIYEKDGVRVTAFAVDHGDEVKPAYGFRIDYGGHSVVLSGDTRRSENLIRHARGADVLVHEVAMAAPALKNKPQIKIILNHHSTPEAAADVFNRVKPKLAVYSHIVEIGAPGIKPPGDDALEAATRAHYRGPLVIGTDLTRFVIADQVTVQHFDRASAAFK
jgi:ribonuclease Z